MKKYTYLNKSPKYLLAVMTIPLAVSVLPITENVYANNEIPKLTIYELNGTPKLEWSTEILQENILNQTSFEVGQEMPNLVYNGKTGQQSITQEDSFTGETSVKLGDMSDFLGNDYSYPSVQSKQSRIQFTDRKYISDGTNLSLNLKVKTDATLSIYPIGIGGKSDEQMTYAEYFKVNEGFKLTKDINIGDKEIYIENSSKFKGLIAGRTMYVIMNKSTNGNYDIAEISNVDTVNGKLTLKKAFDEKWVKGEEILVHRNTNPVAFPTRTISNTNGEWVTISLNTIVDGKNEYNTLQRGFQFWIRNASTGNSYIDDVTFGYATEVEVFREGKSIYRGFLSDFHDKTIKDNKKPNKVSIINGSISDSFDVKFNIEKPIDEGVKTSYQIQSIANNGTRGPLSTPQEFELKTDVVKYKYSITKEPTGVPTKQTSSLNDLSIPLKSINLETDYLHIQAIDGSGNVSEIQSFKVKDIVDTSNLQELYDKLKDIENNNSYEDFIDFIDEIEGLYGGNLPQDLKDRLQQLSEHHGVNTSFLLLEEGEFTLSTMDIDSFGKVKLTAKKQTLTTAFKGDFGVIDARGTQEGWNLSVSATPFTVDTFDGFIGVPHQLPMGSLALNTIINIEQIGQVHNSQLPNIALNELTIIDGENQTVNILNAEKQKGMGEFKFTFSPDALALTVDAVTAKIDTVNYPEQNTPYTSTVTWDLVSGPQL